jgi:hypothetical protein
MSIHRIAVTGTKWTVETVETFAGDDCAFRVCFDGQFMCHAVSWANAIEQIEGEIELAQIEAEMNRRRDLRLAAHA